MYLTIIYILSYNIYYYYYFIIFEEFFLKHLIFVHAYKEINKTELHFKIPK